MFVQFAYYSHKIQHTSFNTNSYKSYLTTGTLLCYALVQACMRKTFTQTNCFLWKKEAFQNSHYGPHKYFTWFYHLTEMRTICWWNQWIMNKSNSMIYILNTIAYSIKQVVIDRDKNNNATVVCVGVMKAGLAKFMYVCTLCLLNMCAVSIKHMHCYQRRNWRNCKF